MSDILHQSDFLFLKEQMIERQLKGRGIHNEAVLSAMHEIPREEFVSKGLVEYAYKDSALPIEEEQTISQPFIVALMAEALDLEPEDKVLDIGTGSGYAAAVLGRIASEVYTIERHKSLAESARDRFKRLGYDNIHVLHGDGSKGWNEHAPFDAINVAAAGKEVPQPIKDQLAEGGRLVIPVGPAPRSQNLIRLVRKDGIVDRENLGQVRFVPLVSSRGNENAGSTIKESGNQRKTIFTMIEHAAEPVQDIGTVDLDALMDRIGDSRVVLMGEASHGTAEFYDMRARMSKELIEQKGFNIVAVEADWPDAAHIDHYARGANAEYSGYKPFTRFPVWMWRNEQVLRFINWLKLYNDTQKKPEGKIGFYGLDLYSMYASSWNLRDSHMFETLEAELEYRGPNAKAVVWAHNSHVGDASATEMAACGEHNIGQLAKENFGRDAYSIGFGTDHGTVAAASNWGGHMEIKKVRPSLPDSVEQLMNQTDIENFMLPLHKNGHGPLTEEMMIARLERAIGVIYRPETELQSHYFQASLADQFDEYIWFNETRSVDALELKPTKKDIPQTFPYGFKSH